MRLDNDMIEMIKEEMKVMNSLDHPNIIKYYEDFDSQKYIFLVMEYFEGQTLFDKMTSLLAYKMVYSEKEAALIMEKLLRAVAHCHENGIAHRDLKLENILVDKSGEIKIIDFGLSKQRNRNLRQFRTKVGTPNYVAPEVIVSDKYGFECDVWSLGVILYILLSGFTPFGGKNTVDTL